MSGHSKWAQIKRQKGTSDVKRGQVFTKLANAITIAVRQSGAVADPDQNPRLRLFIEKAKAENMPKEKIARAIERGIGKGDNDNELQEVSYEAFGPGKVSFIIDVATDNKQRSISAIRNILNKGGGTLANSGSVSYQFEIKGAITVNKNKQTTDEIFLLAADAGAEDIADINETEVIIYTKPEELTKVKDTLSGLDIEAAEIIKKPITTVNVEDESSYAKILALIDEFESLDDVQKVYTNLSRI